VRILLVGKKRFREELLKRLESSPADVVGWAKNSAEAQRMIAELQPDAVVADPTLISSAEELASSPSVVFLFPPAEPSAEAGSEQKPGVDQQFDLVETILTLASARPPVTRQSEKPRPKQG
jgi:DNA-binding NarL/FixJ family response regulator